MDQSHNKKIVVDLTPILPGGENGGAKVFVLELLKHLANMAPQTEFVLLTQAASHEELAVLDRPNMRRLLVVHPSASGWVRKLMRTLARLLMPNVPCVLKKNLSKWGYFLNLALKKYGSKSLMREIGADLLFCPFTAPTFYSLGIPTVSTIYDFQHKTYPEFFLPEDVAYRDFAFSEACSKADALVAISNFSKNEAITYGKFPLSRINTIYLRTAKRFETESPLSDFVIDQTAIYSHRYLLYPANFWKHKNHERLIIGFKMLCHSEFYKDIKLVCSGAPGGRRDEIIDMVYNEGVSGRVIFPGYLSKIHMSILMKNSVGLIFPSLFEGFGMPVVEAMAAGIPVACSNVASLPEVVGDAAILFDPYDPIKILQAMVDLIENDALRARLIQAGHKRAVEFSDSTFMAREYWDIFQHLLDKGNDNFADEIGGLAEKFYA